MNINVKFEYIEKYLPTPRCRKYRTREVKGICTVTVREAPIGKLVPAFGVEQYIWEETPHIENDVIFSNEGSLWKLSRASRYYAGKSWFDLAPCTPEFLACRLEPNRYEIHDFNTDTKRIKAYIQSQADRFLICDGKLYEETTEPMYVIMTFGLGCNHGGSALMIEDYYNSNIPSSRYYAANQREEAIAKAKEVALNRGDTESIHNIETALLIHVYDDRFVTKNPQSWKAPGDEFCNTLEGITETAGDALAAGLMVICATAKSVKRG